MVYLDNKPIIFKSRTLCWIRLSDFFFFYFRYEINDFKTFIIYIKPLKNNEFSQSFAIFIVPKLASHTNWLVIERRLQQRRGDCKIGSANSKRCCFFCLSTLQIFLIFSAFKQRVFYFFRQFCDFSKNSNQQGKPNRNKLFSICFNMFI